jgi:pimeloyl-ACP methyl ester carboxylesterase
MANFVLVHGAWHGGWCWRFVRERLKEHQVFTPSLTGLGERRHLAGPDIDLETHITDVVSLLEMEDLHDVMLVGHSYGGMVVTGAADRVPQRIKRLVYLDAFVPENGKCLLDYVVPERAARMREEGEKVGSVTPPPAIRKHPSRSRARNRRGRRNRIRRGQLRSCAWRMARRLVLALRSSAPR